MKKTYSGFTVIEIIVTIVVIGILLGVVIVGVTSFQNRSKKTDTVAVAEQVKLKLSTYFQSRNRYPATQADVSNYLRSSNATELATKFDNTTTFTYTATATDGSSCTQTGPETCEKYTISVNKSAWNGGASDTNVTVRP